MKRFLHLLPLVLACPALLIACDSAGSSSIVAVRDSADITIVDHRVIDSETLPPWQLSDATLSIGEVDGDEVRQFYGIANLHRRNDGAIAVVDRSKTIRVFDSLGGHLWTAGRDGAGPGEIRYANLVRWLAGDSLAIWDVGLGRLSIFGPGGDFVRDRTVHEFVNRALGLEVVANDRMIVERRTPERTVVDGHQALSWHADVFALSMAEEVTDSIARWSLGVEFQEPAGAYSPAIFAATPVAAPTSSGFWYGSTKETELQHRNTLGSIERLLRWQSGMRAVTTADLDQALQIWEGGPDATPERRSAAREYRETHPVADRFPAFDELRVDRVGRLWVRDHVPGHLLDGQRRWMVFSADGATVLGHVTHSTAFEPFDIGDNWILGVEKDVDGVERVVQRVIVR